VQPQHRLSLILLDNLVTLRKNLPKFAITWNLFDSALGQISPLCNNIVASGDNLNGPCNILDNQAEDGTET